MADFSVFRHDAVKTIIHQNVHKIEASVAIKLTGKFEVGTS